MYVVLKVATSWQVALFSHRGSEEVDRQPDKCLESGTIFARNCLDPQTARMGQHPKLPSDGWSPRGSVITMRLHQGHHPSFDTYFVLTVRSQFCTIGELHFIQLSPCSMYRPSSPGGSWFYGGLVQRGRFRIIHNV